jgi:twitching motility protein PilT
MQDGVTHMEGIENRKAPRRRIRIPVMCWDSDGEHRSSAGKEYVSKDVSVGGVAFYSSHVYPIGKTLFLEIYLPSRKKPITCSVKIVSLEALLHKDEYVIGASFIDLSTEERLLLSHTIEKMDLYQLLERVVKQGATDLHLTVGRPPMIRNDDRLSPIEGDPIDQGQVEAMLYSLLSADQIKSFERSKELNFAFSPDLTTRFRVNMHWQKGYVEAVLKNIPTKIKSFAELGLVSELMEKLCYEKSGLILIAGEKSSGKTTTLSAMVDYINRHMDRVILTIEDPIEYMFKSERAIVKQRELGNDTLSYAEALKHGLRQDPDVICIGELTDEECFLAAMRAAETGRLVIATVDASDSASAIERVVNLISTENVLAARQQLSSCLLGILAQRLLPSLQEGRVLVSEMLLNTGAMRNLIREGKYSQIVNVLQTGRALGMYTFHNSAMELARQGHIDATTANSFAKQSYA